MIGIEYVALFFNALIDLSVAMAPYIVFGLFFAGILHELVPDTLVSKHLGKDSIGSVIKATIFGVPLPVCSCGVIPLATSIKKSGASKGATLSFLISTPITGVDSILATYGMFGWIFTVYRVVTSMFISIIAGILANVFDTKEPKMSFFINPDKEQSSLTCKSSCECESQSIQKRRFSLKRAIKYAFGTLLGDIASALFFGLIIGALITVAIPSNLSEIILKYSWLSYLIVILIAVPMYVCATASLPIAAALMLSGVSPGAAFVFLSAGPATNTVTIGVVKKMLGKRVLYIYLGSIILGSVLFGFGLDYLLRDVSIKEMIHTHDDIGILEWISTLFLWIMVLYFIIKPYFKKDDKSCCTS
jgi:uncharacterized membrane protein YraQ (UPF0718 family)